MKRVRILLVLVLICGCTLAACTAQRSRPNVDEKQAGPWQPTQHWIYDDQLQQSMRTIDHARLVTGELAGSANATDSVHEFLKASRAAEQLAESANTMADDVNRFNLGLEDRKVFLELSRAMHDQALAAGRSARDRRTNDFRRHLDAIQATCISCHTRFRDFAAELAPPRV